MTIDKQDLRALAEAATPNQWSCSDKHDGRFWHVHSGNQAIGATHAAGRKSLMAGVFEANAKFIAAACPATVLALLAEIEQLQESHEQVCINYNRVSFASEECGKERDQLKAENAWPAPCRHTEVQHW